MASIEQLKRALKNADAAGDTAAATKLASAIRAQMATPNGLRDQDDLKTTVANLEKEDQYGTVGSAARGALQGATFGFADELTGAGSAALNLVNPWSEESTADNYTRVRDASRVENEKASRDNPFAYGAGDVAGSAASALVPGLGAAGMGVRGAALAGAAAGGLRGAGDAESIMDVPGSAVTGAAMGGATGGALSGVAKPALQYGGQAAQFAGDLIGGRALDAVKRTRLGPMVDAATGTIDDLVDGGIDKLSTMSPRAAQLAGDAYAGLGGGSGVASRAAGAYATGGGNLAAEAGLKIGGRGAQAASGAVGSPITAGVAGNAVGSGGTGSNPMRDPYEVARRAAGSKWAGQLEQAAHRGREAFMATVHVLASRDPEFRALFKD